MSGAGRAMQEGPDPLERDLIGPTKRISFDLEGVGEWEILVPQTVYPPREDTLLLAQALGSIQREMGLGLEIGCMVEVIRAGEIIPQVVRRVD